MGTRADFYVGRGKDAEWIGSIAFDGYPCAKTEPVYKAKTAAAFRAAVAELTSGDDGTKPEMGWPWPWEDSRTTDFAYAFDGGCVWASSFGGGWFDPSKEPDENATSGREGAVFPDMSARQSVTLGPRSGVMVLGLK